MLLGAAIFPECRKYGGGPEKMAILAARQRWRRFCGDETELQAASLCRTLEYSCIGVEHRVFKH